MTKTKRLVIAALFAALCCAVTFSVRIPVPATGGYIHPGDAVVILTGAFLGPAYGFLAAGIGSGLADMLGGFFIYAPVTFLIKGLSALAAGLLFHSKIKNNKWGLPGIFLGGIMNLILVVGGYFLFEAVLYGAGAAAGGVIANIIQSVSGIILSIVLYPVLSKIPHLQQ